MISLDEAVDRLRADPRYASVIREAYLDVDLFDAASRFRQSGEFAEVLKLVGGSVAGQRVLDLGAGRGIASFAFGREAPRAVYALDPDPSSELGWGASARLARGLPIRVLGGVGEALPLRNEAVDIAYTRQVLHHTSDLFGTLRECARVLKGDGLLVATREHVVDDEDQLRRFLRDHPIHQLAGGENAYRLDEYVAAIKSAGLEMLQILGPWDSVVNAFPAVESNGELERYPGQLLRLKFGTVGDLIARWPGIDRLIWRRLKRPVPGRLYSFLARKPPR